MFRTFFRSVRKLRSRYAPLIEISIYKDRLLSNLRAFQETQQSTIAPVLKSNAYGHGLVEVAKILENELLPFLCVDSYFEAVVLRNEGIRHPLLVLGYTPFPNINTNKLPDVAFAILSISELARLTKELKRPQRFHLEIDTGMHRHGIPHEEIGSAVSLIRANRHMVIEGVYSHLADAENVSSNLTPAQISKWNDTARMLQGELPSLRYLHLAATSGSVYAERMNANVMRLGIGLYGIQPHSESSLRLLPALSMRAPIASLENIGAGESVGYGATFTATKSMKLATIPVGYYEGLDRRLSGKGFVAVHGTPCAIVGRVSMNIATIDVSAFPELALDEPATIISADLGTKNSVIEIAELCGTIPYEILVHIPAHLRRIVC